MDNYFRDNITPVETVVREVYTLDNRGKGLLSGLTAASFFLVSRDTTDSLSSIFSLHDHKHESTDVDPDPRKVDKVVSSGDERVYIINPDGTQGVKDLSDISPDNKLDKDFVTLPAANLPTTGQELVAVNQDGQARYLPLNEIKSNVNFVSDGFTYTSGPQEFITRYPIAQVLAVFVGGQFVIDYTYTTSAVTILATSAIVPGTGITVIYAEGLVGANLFYTKAEVNDLIKKSSEDVQYKTAADAPVLKNTVIGSRYEKFLTVGCVLKKVNVLFGEQSVSANKAIPIIISLMSTNSGAPSNTVVYTANCNAVTGLIYHKTYGFAMDVVLSANTLLVVSTGDFIDTGQTLKDCLVTLTLENI
jgi:hypothetical protein